MFITKKIAILFVTLLLSLIAVAQENSATVKGKITDAKTGESLIGVTIFVEETSTGTITKENGTYELSLQGGSYTLKISYLGYKTTRKIVKLKSNATLIQNFKLEEEETELDEVVVTGRKKDANISEALMSAERIQMVTIKKMPALMGEVDIIKAIQMLPGVQAASEGSSNFSVRGGNTDHNLILLDNATIYNASHMMGFFSVFNNDAISNATLFKGDIPAYYGGRLASVLDVQSRDAEPQKFSASGGIGLISSRLMLEAPLFNKKTTVMIAGRRTYADLFLPFSKNENLEDSYLYFYDLNAKITQKINRNNKLILSGYLGNDKFGMDEIAGLDFGNKSFTLAWKHIFSQNLFSSLEGSGSNYKYGVAMDMKPYDFYYEAGIKDWGLKYDITKTWSSKNTSKAGITGIFHRFNLGELKNNQDSKESIIMIEDSAVGCRKSLEYAFYLSHEQVATRRLTLKYGLRLSMFQNVGGETFFKLGDNYNIMDTIQYKTGDTYNTYFNPEPRLGLLYKLTNTSSLKAAYTRTVQYSQIASSSTGGLPFDIWIPSNPNLKPQKCDQWTIGYFKNFNDDQIETSAEIYYKNLHNVLDFKDNPNFFGNPQIDAELRKGKGRAYGIELMVKKNNGKLTGWISYAFSRTFRTVDDINMGKEYRSPYDRPHYVNVVANYEFTKRFNISLNWIYSSGQAVTFPIGKYIADNTPYAIYSGSRNRSRYPAYHRLDISANLKTKEKKWKKWEGEWNFSLYNAYGHHNTWAILFSPDSSNNNIITERMYLFSIVPSVSYNFKF